MLFERAAVALQTRRFDEAIADYDRLIREFPRSNLVAASHFNRGQAFQSTHRASEAIEAYTASATAAQGSNDDLARDAWFRVAVVAESANRPAEIITATERVLALPRVSLVDRVEALARQAAARLALGDRQGAARVAQEAISLAPTPEAVSALGDDTFIAQARFVLAEVSRLEAAAIPIRIDAREEELNRAIERRVQHVTHAHVLYNDAIRVGNPHWAAASGYAIGEMYHALYAAIVEAPLPCEWEEPAIRIYRQRTATRLRPLIQGALRAWEATIAMARRNAIADNAWVRRAEEQVESLRHLVLNGPDPALLRRSSNCLASNSASTASATSAQPTASNEPSARP
jgi:tetratricopeptide (TPR) repeat protein